MAKFKTKFDSIVKLKKLKVDECQNEMTQLNNKIFEAQKEMDDIQQQINEFQYPKDGSFAIMKQSKSLLNAIVSQKNTKQEQINFLNSQKDILVNNLKNANLEYEKMKYLQAEEIKKYLQELKQKEVKELDEIALMLYKK